jgi:polysaccharide export outer membrane protein
MKGVKQIMMALVAALLLTACTSYKSVPYFTNSEEVNTEASSGLYESKICPQDQLSILVSSFTRDASSQFNLIVPSEMSATSGRSYLTQQPTVQTYIVSKDGYVEMPILGKVKVAGLTRVEAEKLISDRIKATGQLTEDFIVTVRFVNFRVSVLGEVTTPGSYTVTTEKTSILDAIALAHDLTIWGVRDNVKLIREDPVTGQKTYHTLNLNDANIVNSPYFYLQQNDVVYVTPNKTKAKNSDVGNSTTLWFSATSILVSVASLLYNILR